MFFILLFCFSSVYAYDSEIIVKKNPSLVNTSQFCLQGGNCSFNILNVTVHNVNLTNSSGDLYMNNNSIYDVNHIDPEIDDSDPTHEEGRFYYINGEDKTWSIMTEINGVSNQIGQELWIRGVNKAGSEIENGKAVYISGGQGGRPTFDFGCAFCTPYANIVGLSTHNFSNNNNGYITTQGLVRDLDTSAWNVGDFLYLSTQPQNGNLTNSVLGYPYFTILMGVVTNSNVNEGSIYVTPNRIDPTKEAVFEKLGSRNGSKLAEITQFYDFEYTSPTDWNLTETARLDGNNGNFNTSGNVSADYIEGDGSLLTGMIWYDDGGNGRTNYTTLTQNYDNNNYVTQSIASDGELEIITTGTDDNIKFGNANIYFWLDKGLSFMGVNTQSPQRPYHEVFSASSGAGARYENTYNGLSCIEMKSTAGTVDICNINSNFVMSSTAAPPQGDLILDGDGAGRIGTQGITGPLGRFHTESRATNEIALFVKGETGDMTVPVFNVRQGGTNNDVFAIWDDDGRTHIGGESPNALLEVTGDTILGDYSNSDYSYFDDNGSLTLNGEATTFDDLRVSLDSVRLPLANPPDEVAYKGGLVIAFDNTNDEFVYFTFQTPHNRKDESDLGLHLHWVTPNDNNGCVVWNMTCSVTAYHNDFPTETAYGGTFCNDGGDNHTIADMGDISGTGLTFSSVGLCKLFRDANNGNDNYTSDAYALFVDLHYEIDSLGSDTEYVK